MSKNTRNRILLTAVAALLLVAVTVGGTMAWLAAETTPVTNTFTTSKVDVTLEETTTTYKMIPGHTIAKDPKVTLAAGSEDSFVFVKIEKSPNYDTYMTYTVNSNWTKLESASSGLVEVYYCNLSAGESADVLAGNIVTVKESVTNVQMEAAQTTAPTLTFTAYAVQEYKTNGTAFTAAEAWDAVFDSNANKVANDTTPKGDTITNP